MEDEMNAEQLAQALSRTGGQSPRVYVYCREKSHAEREWDVQRFLLNRQGQWITERTFHSNGRRLHRPDGDWVTLVDGQHIGERELGQLPDGALSGARLREHYELKCGRCDLRKRAPGEKLIPILDTLAVNGVTEISLARLAARL